MKVLSFDQSTKKSGWAIFEDGQYANSGVIDLHLSKEATEKRSEKMAVEMCKLIERNKPDVVVIEEVAMTSNPQTLKLLARIQGVAIGFCAAHNIPLHILEPTRWRSSLLIRQGPKVKREELKAQSLEFVKEHFGITNCSDDRAEAICINEAAHRIYGFIDDDDDI